MSTTTNQKTTMLIFDKFTSRSRAITFAEQVRKRFGREATVCDSQEESDAIDPFPWVLAAPIVLVERDDERTLENEIETLGEQFTGTYAGT